MKVTEIDIGDTVICDYCNTDYTNSDETGGICFGGDSICPKCTLVALEEIKTNDEEEYIDAYCPDDMTFKDFVLTLRHGDNLIKFVEYYESGEIEIPEEKKLPN
jgi:hypothetical protein